MNTTDLLNACITLSVNTSYTSKNNLHDLTSAVLELQICLEEMGKRKTNELNKLLAEV